MTTFLEQIRTRLSLVPPDQFGDCCVVLVGAIAEAFEGLKIMEKGLFGIAIKVKVETEENSVLEELDKYIDEIERLKKEEGDEN